MDGKTVSCMVLALDARDKEITTVEGLRQGNTLHPVQAAFVQYGGCAVRLLYTRRSCLE